MQGVQHLQRENLFPETTVTNTARGHRFLSDTLLRSRTHPDPEVERGRELP